MVFAMSARGVLLVLALSQQALAFQHAPILRTNIPSARHIINTRRPVQQVLPAKPRLQHAPQGVKGLGASMDMMSALAPALQAMSSTASSLSGVAVLAGVIAFHEAGHFLAARSQGIIVQDFSIGFGPKLINFVDGNGINYSLRMLPLGGYVSFPEALGEDEEDEMEDEPLQDGEERKIYEIDNPDLLQNRPAAQRALVISAGVIFNMILSYVAILASVATVGVSQFDLRPGVVIPQVVDASGAGQRYGLKAGDIVLEVDGKKIGNQESVTAELVSTIKSRGGKTIHFQVQRGSNFVEMDVIPDKTPEGQGVVGVKLASNVVKVAAKKPTDPVDAVGLAAKEFITLLTQTLKGFASIVANFGQMSGNLAGPVGVMQMGAEAGQQGALLTFAALISLNLGIMNALPLPALDGGQMAFLMVEAVRGKPLDQKVIRSINGFFISGLLMLSLALLLTDIERLIPSSLSDFDKLLKK